VNNKDIRNITRRLFESAPHRNLELIEVNESSPKIINAIVEIPKGTSAKYEYNAQLDTFQLDRCLPSSMKYPCSYGFVPSTLAEDNDPLDILIYNETPIDRGTLVECNVIGVLDMKDSGGQDWKILGTPTSHVRNYRSMRDIDPMFIKVASYFFKHYKDLNNKYVEVGEWHGKQFAYDIIKDCCNRFNPKESLEKYQKPIDISV
jgi:inorganic pyrophosphatase|tara:strand:+ start:623 stop:1234 length:612 start_codon:yes stop_codon:yes gene_type:complete